MTSSTGKKFVAIRAQGALRADVPVECLPGDAEVATKVGDLGLVLAHGGHGQAQLGAGHLVGTATLAAARPSRGQAGAGALADELALELGECGEDAGPSLPAAVVVSIVAP